MDRPRFTPRALVPALAALSLLLGACAPQAAPSPTAAPATKPTTAPAAAPTTSGAPAPAAAATTAPATAASPVAAAKPTTAAGAAPAPAASATSQGKTGGTLRLGTSTDVLTLDMANYRSGQDWLVGSLVFDTLVTVGRDGKLQPGLAESWKQVDPLTYTFTLKKGVKFSDGTPFDGNAVKQQFERAAQGVFGRSYYYMIDSITPSSDGTVTFKLKQPYAPFVNSLAIMTGGIEAPSSIQQYGDDVAHHPVGTGPYMVTSWTPGDQMVLDRNPSYWGAAPKLDKIVLKFVADENTRLTSLQAGELDAIQNPPPAQVNDLKRSQTLQVYLAPYAQSIWLGFTASNPLLSDARVRQAIAMMIDRKGLVDGVTEGQTRVATGFIPPEDLQLGTQPVSGDAAKAKQLLADAGHPNGFQIELWSTNGRYLADQQIASAIQQELKPIGIDVQVKVMDYAAFSTGMGQHQAGLFILGWGSTVNPDTMLRAVWSSKSASNWSDYKNPDVDALIDKAVGESSFDAATQDWKDLDQKLVADGAGVPIYWANSLFAMSKKVHDFYASPFGTFDLTATWME